MPELRVSIQVAPTGVFRLDLDDFEAIIDVFRSGTRSFRVMAEGKLLFEPYDLEKLRKSRITSVDIEAHEPYLRWQMSRKPGGKHAPSICIMELVTVRGEGDAPFERIERIIVASRREEPLRDWWREVAPVRAQRYSNALGCGLMALPALLFAVACCGLMGVASSDQRRTPGPNQGWIEGTFSVLLLASLISGLLAWGLVFDAYRTSSIAMTRGRKKLESSKEGLEL